MTTQQKLDDLDRFIFREKHRRVSREELGSSVTKLTCIIEGFVVSGIRTNPKHLAFVLKLTQLVN